jgi:hypothetical protein
MPETVECEQSVAEALDKIDQILRAEMTDFLGAVGRTYRHPRRLPSARLLN